MCAQIQLINSQVSLQNTGFQYNFQSTFTLYSLTYTNIKLILNLKIMKKILSLLSILMMVLVVMGISSCKKSDQTPIELPSNAITISGNTTTANNKTYIPDPLNCYYMTATAACAPITYHSYISIGLATHESFYVYITSASSDVIPTGTININDVNSCLVGFYGGFIPALSKKAGSNLYFSGGTITIAKSGVNYSVDVDLTIYPENGGGKITGNFNGPLIEQLPPK